VLFAEPLLDEYLFQYDLDSVAEHWLQEGKKDEMLYEWLFNSYGGQRGRKQIANIYRAPVSLAGPYAEADADLPMRIWQHQQKQLEAEGLMDVFRMECDLIYMLVEMRWRGVRVDVPGAAKAREMLLKKEAEITKELGGINVNSSHDLKRVFDKDNVWYPKTKKGNPSFAKAFLEACEHPLAKKIMAKRKLETARTTFLEGYILNMNHNGRLHGEFHPLRSDDGGTVSGRFSSSNPNLTNIPSRDKEIKKLVRGLFLPEEGEEWYSYDYDQIEYKLMVHAAVGPGAEEARQQFINDPTTDYHAFTQQLISDLLGREIDRKPTKNINFGKIFGMSKGTLIKQLPGLTEDEAAQFFDQYDQAIPYAKTTHERAMEVAKNRSYIRTILNRRARFPYWEPFDWELRKYVKMSRDKVDIERQVDELYTKIVEGKMDYPSEYRTLPLRGAQRAMLNKALNCFTQGSGADILKKAMLDLWKGGYPVPLITVHDELDFSQPRDSTASKDIVDIMQNAVKLKIPVTASMEKGPNWGDCK